LSTSFRLLLPRQFYADMVAQAQAELPNECCGLLAGRIANEMGRVLRRFPLVNAAASPREFDSEPHSMFAAVKEMRREGLDLLAVYHSHPTSAPDPSRTDLERNYSPEVMNLIVSLAVAVPEMRAWWLAPEGFKEAQVEWLDEI
jgi:proteasome lid subunit RPN8/RPN11